MTEPRIVGVGRRNPSLLATLLVLIAAALLAGIVPAGMILDRRLAQELEQRVHNDLEQAPLLLMEHYAAVSDALMMYAKEMAYAPGLHAAVVRDDRDAAVRIIEETRTGRREEPVLVTETRRLWMGPTRPPAEMVDATRRGEMPVGVVCDGNVLRIIGLAPVEQRGAWVGAAGVAAPLDEVMAATLAGLTRSDLVFLGKGGSLTTTNSLREDGRAIARTVAAWPRDGQVRELHHEGRRYLAVTATLDHAFIVFLRDMEREMAVLPQLRTVAALSGAGALAVALLLGALLAVMLARPVEALADASDRLADGDFDAPLPASPVRELDQVSHAFGTMRRSLAARLNDLKTANRKLAERQSRLTALQSELIQRERHAVSARLVAELAHEIRNPVANLRNCLELLHRRLEGDAEAQEFSTLAIDELLRMHELAERMLDLNRPRDPALAHCDAAEVAREVAALACAGRGAEEIELSVHGRSSVEAAIAPDALKQVLLNLVQNAREARPEGLIMAIDVWQEGPRVVVEVADNGPGVPEHVQDRAFEPFVTSKSESGGAGLGLYVVDGTLRRYGSRIALCTRYQPESGDRPPLQGACFRITLPRYTPGDPTRADLMAEAGASLDDPARGSAAIRGTDKEAIAAEEIA